MRPQFRLRTLLILTAILAVPFEVVRITRRPENVCYVQVDVDNPGRQDIGWRLRVKSAIQAAGNLTSNADRRNVRLIRATGSGKQVFSIDLDDPAMNYSLKPGDRLVIFRRHLN